MSIETELESKSSLLYGVRATEAEIEEMRQKLSPQLVRPWFATLLANYPLAGVTFTLDETDDQSELGVALKWMTPADIVEEAIAYYPGISVLNLGYVPIGGCMEGSGDPYFVKTKNGTDDPALVRVYHDLVRDDDGYPEEEMGIVCRSLSTFFGKTKIE